MNGNRHGNGKEFSDAEVFGCEQARRATDDRKEEMQLAHSISTTRIPILAQDPPLTGGPRFRVPTLKTLFVVLRFMVCVGERIVMRFRPP